MKTGARMDWPTRIVLMLPTAALTLLAAALCLGPAQALMGIALAAWDVRGWQPVQAQVLATALDTQPGPRGSTSYRVQARYAYDWQGRRLTATRIGLPSVGAADALDDWHRNWHQRLLDAKDREQALPAWVNPRDPQHALLDRGVRWGGVQALVHVTLIVGGLGALTGWGFVLAAQGRLIRQGGVDATMRAAMAAAASEPHTLPVPPPRPGTAVPDLPPSVRGDLAQGGLRFVRRWPRVLGIALLGIALDLAPMAMGMGQTPGGSVGLAATLAAIALLAALGLHLLTERWTWQLQGDAVQVERRSCLRRRLLRLARADLAQLENQHRYQSRTGKKGQTVLYRRLQLNRGGQVLALTPALPGTDAVLALAWRLHAGLSPGRPDVAVPAGGP